MIQINRYIRKFYQTFFSGNKKEKKVSPFWAELFTEARRFFETLGYILLGILQATLLLFVLGWIFIAKLYFVDNKYYTFLGRDASSFISFLGFFVLILFLMLFNDPISKFINVTTSLLGKVKKQIVQSFIWRMPSNIIFYTSKLWFNRFLLPNIDLIEVGLEGQQTNLFPETLIFTPIDNRKVKNIRQVQYNYALFSLLIPIGILLLSIAILLFVVVPVSRIGDLLGFQVLVVVGRAISYIALFLAWLFIFLTLIVFVFIWHPSSLINQRIKVLENEVRRIWREEWLKDSVQQANKDANKLIDNYSTKLVAVQSALNQELHNLSTAEKKVVVTKELIDRTRNLIKDDEDAVRMLLKESQDLEEERENKKYWKDKIIDIGIGIVVGIVVGIITGFLLGR